MSSHANRPPRSMRNLLLLFHASDEATEERLIRRCFNLSAVRQSHRSLTHAVKIVLERRQLASIGPPSNKSVLLTRRNSFQSNFAVIGTQGRVKLLSAAGSAAVLFNGIKESWRLARKILHISGCCGF